MIGTQRPLLPASSVFHTIRTFFEKIRAQEAPILCLLLLDPDTNI
jgi:hypothetical protein